MAPHPRNLLFLTADVAFVLCFDLHLSQHFRACRLAKEIRALLARGGTLQEAMREVGVAERDNWHLFDDYNPRNVATSFTELEWE